MAFNRIKGLTVEIGGDTTKLGKALESVNRQSKSLQNELTGVNSLLKMDPGNTELLAQKQKILTSAINETSEKLRILKEAQSQVQAQFERGEIGEEQYRDFQREIVSTEQKLKSLTDQMKEFGSVSAQKIAVAGEKVQEVGGKVEAVGKKFMVASTVAAGALVGVTTEAINFETAWTGVTKTVDGTDEQLEKIRQGLLDLSQQTGSSAEEIAGVAEAAGQLGVKTENILDFTETMVRLGDSTNLSAEEAASAIAQLYNVMGADINTVDQFGSALVTLGNNSATTEADILNMATRIASSGSQIGLTEQEVLALAATLSSVGMEAEAGGSAISAIMTQIDKDVATGSDTLATWASTAGMSVGQFRDLWQKDAMSAIQAVIGGMGDAKAGGENLNLILEELGITSLRQTDTMKRLSNAAELMGTSVDLSNEAWAENTSLVEESDKRYETTASKMQQLKNTITELCVNLGDILLPIVQGVTDKIKSFADWLTNLSPAAQKVVLAVTALVAALGPVLITVGKLISSVGSIMTLAPQIVSILGTIKTALSGLFTLISTNPVIAIITAVIAAVVLLYNNCEWFRDAVNAIWAKIKEVAVAVFNVLVEFFTVTIPDAINTVARFFTETLPNAFNTVVDWIKTNWQGLLLLIVNPVAGIFKLLYDNCEGFRTKVNAILTAVKQGFSNFVAFLQSIPSRVAEFVTNVIAFIQQLPYKIGYFLGSVIGKVASWVVNMVAKAKQAGSQFVSSVVSFVQQLPGKVASFLSSVISKVTSWASNMISKAKQAGSQFVSSVVSFVQQLPGKLWSLFTQVVSRVVQWGSDMVAKGKAAASKLVDTVVNTVKALPNKMLSIGKDVVRGIWDGITSMGSWLHDKISGFVDGILDGFKDTFGINSPSKETAWMGEMLDKGLAEGLTAHISEPIKAMQRVSGAVLGAGAVDAAGRALRQTISPTSAVASVPAYNDSSLLSKLEGIYERLGRLQVVLDTGTLVGETIDKIDAGLASRQLLSARGV